MKYLDPLRPTVNGFPMLLKGATPLCAMPSLYLGPSADGRKVTVAVHLPTADNAFRAFYAVVDDLTAFWTAWMDDPEAVLEGEFKFKYESIRAQEAPDKPQVGVASSLEELGLE